MSSAWMEKNIFLGMPFGSYLKSLLTWQNLLLAFIILPGLYLLGYRFYAGLGATTNLTQQQPWGIWIGFDMMTGIALAAGGFTVGAAVEIFNLKKFHAIERPAILTGFLGYLMAVFGLIADLGKPWNMVGIFQYNGTQSVLFEVAWCVALYTTVLFLEFSVPLFEWLKIERLYKPLKKSLLALTVLSVMFSTMHQSALGSLFIIAPGKLHPLWYSQMMFILFFVSAAIAGLCMVIVESAISHKVFSSRVDHHIDILGITIGLAKTASILLFAYAFLKLQAVIDNHALEFIGVGFHGKWWLVEMLVFIALPCGLLAFGSKRESLPIMRWGAAIGVLGIVVNRLNVSVIAWDWKSTNHYVPSLIEVWVSLTLVCIGVVMFRWIVLRMDILSVKHEA